MAFILTAFSHTFTAVGYLESPNNTCLWEGALDSAARHRSNMQSLPRRKTRSCPQSFAAGAFRNNVMGTQRSDLCCDRDRADYLDKAVSVMGRMQL